MLFGFKICACKIDKSLNVLKIQHESINKKQKVNLSNLRCQIVPECSNIREFFKSNPRLNCHVSIRTLNKMRTSVTPSGVRPGHHPEPAQSHRGVHKGRQPDAGRELHRCRGTRGQVSTCTVTIVCPSQNVLTFDGSYSPGFLWFLLAADL